jgi:hypothetical protein
MRVGRIPPHIVIQRSNESCWAAALESWIETVGDLARKQTQEQLLSGLAGRQGEWLRVNDTRYVAASFGMDTEFFSPSDFNADRLQMLIKTKSTLFIGFELGKYQQWWHNVLLYGITSNPRDEPRYEVMDPAVGYRVFRRPDFFPAGPDEPVLVGWKTSGRAGKLL